MGAGLLLLYSGAGHLLLEHVDLLHQLADYLVNSSLVVEVKLRKEEGQNPAQEQQAQGVEPGTYVGH